MTNVNPQHHNWFGDHIFKEFQVPGIPFHRIDGAHGGRCGFNGKRRVQSRIGIDIGYRGGSGSFMFCVVVSLMESGR